MVKNEVKIQMEDSTTTYLFRDFATAEDFAERAVHIFKVVQVSINGDNLLPETFVMPGGAE